jgi:predicted transcriptional regulator
MQTRESVKLRSNALSRKKQLSNQEEKLEGIKEWENREAEGSFCKHELVSKKRHH